MHSHKPSIAILAVSTACLILIGCLPAQQFSPELQLSTPSRIETQTLLPRPTITPSFYPPTSSPTKTPIIPSPTSTPIPEAWVTVLPDQTLTIPILLYHHIADYSGSDARYYVSPVHFAEQLKVLKALGYTSITVTELALALTEGGSLPPLPIVLTFDDGNLDLFEEAFPLMQEYGFVGTMYLIVGDIKKGAGLTVKQAQEMASAGWEIAGHSMTHADLLKSTSDLRTEICYSRLDLEDLLEMPIYSFSYPYGSADYYVKHFARDCGYTSAVGIGSSTIHTTRSLYFLSRREVQGDFDIETFSNLLHRTETQ